MSRSLLAGALVVGMLVGAPVASAAKRPTFPGPTTSSPITLSRDGRLLWVVNPGNDTVSVIAARRNRVLQTIRVGDEPQAVAIDWVNKFAFVANAGSSNVTVIRITNPRDNRFRARRFRTFTTGAEPWNILTSPDGRRVFVANSGQDTITVIDALRPRVIGHVNLQRSLCNDPDRQRHFQPRGLAMPRTNRRLYVTSFFAWTRPGGRHGEDAGREGVVCRLNVRTKSRRIRDYRAARRIAVAPQVTGFKIDSTGDGTPDNTFAFPNQLQSIVIRRGVQAYLPNIAASPTGPLRFNVDTHAFVNVLDISGSERDASAAKFVNLHLGARNPEPNKARLFFANAWAMAFVERGGADAVYGNSGASAYVVSAGSDLLVKAFVRPDGKLVFTGDNDTTRYIDLNDPANPATAGANAGKNPQGIAVNRSGTRAFVANFLSGNVSVVDLTTDSVIRSIRTAPLPAPGSPQEVARVGAEIFFSSRGPGERLSSEGWQSCSSCHFEGLTDSVVWQFAAGPRKSVPLNATFNPLDGNDQRVLNYSAIFDEVEDFEANIRNVSGPGALQTALACSEPPPPTSTFDPKHGLMIGDNGDPQRAPCVINAFGKPNAGRPQITVTLPGSGTAVPALTALREWVKVAVRTPNGPLTRDELRGGVSDSLVEAGRQVFERAGCASCHGGPKWTISRKDFTSPPAAAELAVENANPAPAFGNPVALQYLHRFLRDVGSFNRGVPGSGNELGANIGAAEKAAPGVVGGRSQAAQDALGIDYNGDGKGTGYNVPSLLGIAASPPYFHNGACETLACVVGDVKHRTANGKMADGITSASDQAAVIAYLRSIDLDTQAFPAP